MGYYADAIAHLATDGTFDALRILRQRLVAANIARSASATGPSASDGYSRVDVWDVRSRFGGDTSTGTTTLTTEQRGETEHLAVVLLGILCRIPVPVSTLS